MEHGQETIDEMITTSINKKLQYFLSFLHQHFPNQYPLVINNLTSSNSLRQYFFGERYFLNEIITPNAKDLEGLQEISWEIGTLGFLLGPEQLKSSLTNIGKQSQA